jgi:hypothetical protein
MFDEHFLYFFYNTCVSHVHFTSLRNNNAFYS